MKARILDPVALSAITPAALRGYATFEGWRHVEAHGPNGEVYIKSSERSGEVEVVLPVKPKLGDYPTVVAQVISIFARESGLDELAVFRDLTHADRDVIRVRSPEADDDGSIAIEPGVELVSHARDVLASAACSAREARPYYHVGKIQQVSDYLRRVRLGQTEVGSFVVTLLAPVSPTIVNHAQPSLWPDMGEEPFDRQVTRTLATGLRATADALAALNRGGDIKAFESRISQGVSANLCDSLAAIAEQAGGVELSVTWARTRPAPTARTQIEFARNDAEPLREVARYFRAREPRPEATIFGTPTKFQRRGKQMLGLVTLAAVVDDHPRSVNMALEAEDYARALDAHKRRLPVTVVGDLVGEGQRWRLNNPRNLSIVNVAES